MPDKLL